MVERANQTFGEYPEMGWLSEHDEEVSVKYSGQYVAVNGHRIVAHGTRLLHVINEARAHGVEEPFVTLIPQETLEEQLEDMIREIGR